MKPGRRQLLQWAGAAAALSFVPSCGDSDGTPPSTGFFSDGERRTLSALADVVIPPGGGPGDRPGGAALGAVTYIERLCTAFDAPVPLIFAGGPFSGRRPFPPNAGGPEGTSPPNDFATFLPLDRATELAWRLELYGSAAVPGGAPNEALVGATVGIRDQLKAGLADAMAGSARPIEDVFAGLDVDFRDLIIELVTQATFSAPEYGGNVDLGGWKLARYEGDSLPFGYSIYREGGYSDAPGTPVAGPNEAPDPAPMDADTLAFARAVVGFLGGREVT